MIRVTLVPRKGENLYGMMVKKELDLRNKNQGTLHRVGLKKRGEDKWKHTKYNGRIQFQKCLGNIVIATVHARSGDDEWQILTSFLGFMDRHFRPVIDSMTLSYGLDGIE